MVAGSRRIREEERRGEGILLIVLRVPLAAWAYFQGNHAEKRG